MDSTQTLTIWQLILAILLPTLITAIPSIISAMAAVKAGNKTQTLQLANAKLEEEKTEALRRQADGQYANDVIEGYTKLSADLRIEREKMKLDRIEDQKKMQEYAVKIERCEKRITILEGGVRKLIRQLKIIAPDVTPAFELPEEK